jgi:excinuclease UvrABC nuclease subunit
MNEIDSNKFMKNKTKRQRLLESQIQKLRSSKKSIMIDSKKISKNMDFMEAARYRDEWMALKEMG